MSASVTIRSSRRMAALYRHHLTPPGRALLWALLAALFLRMGALSPPLYVTLAFLAALCAVAVLSGLPFRPRVSLRRRLLHDPTAGRPWFYEVEVHNDGKRPARDLVVEEIGLPWGLEAAPGPEPIPYLAPGERTSISLGLTFPRRGIYELPTLQATTLFPTGLVKPGRRHERSDRLVVHPAYDKLPDIQLPSGGRRDEGGRAMRRDGMDFAGLRDWRDGDRPRDVHWPGYARTGRLVVRETVDEGRPSVALVLDTRPLPKKQAARFEAAVSKAASLAEVLLRQGHGLDLVLAGPTAHRPGPVGTRGRLEAILDVLAEVEPGPSIDADLLESEARGLSVVLLVVPKATDEHAELTRELTARGVATRIVEAEEA